MIITRHLTRRPFRSFMIRREIPPAIFRPATRALAIAGSCLLPVQWRLQVVAPAKPFSGGERPKVSLTLRWRCLHFHMPFIHMLFITFIHQHFGKLLCHCAQSPAQNRIMGDALMPLRPVSRRLHES